jgi:nucleoid DNA-binding protein
MGKANLKLYKNNNSNSKTFGKVYGRVKIYSTIGAKDLCSYAAADSKVEEAKVEVVTLAIFKQVKELVCNGHFIRLPELGTLKLSVRVATDENGKSVGGAASEEEFNCAQHLGRARIVFVPTDDIKTEMQAVKFDASKDPKHKAELQALHDAQQEDDGD